MYLWLMMGVLFWSVGCLALSGKPTPAYEFSQEPIVSSAVFVVQPVPLDQALQYFDNELDRLKLETYENWVRQGAKAWFSVYKAGPDNASMHSGIVWIVDSEKPLVGYLIVQNGWQYTHDVDIIFTLDYRQVQLTVADDALDTMPSFTLMDMQPGEQRALTIQIPSLSEGEHRISTLYVPGGVKDPDATLENLERSRQINQGAGPSMSILSVSNKDVLAQVTSELGGSRLPHALESSIPYIKTRPFRPEEIVRITSAWLSTSSQLPGAAAASMTEGWLQANEVATYPLKLLGGTSTLYQGDVPFQIGVFWNNVMYQSDHYEVPSRVIYEGESIPITIQSPSAPGEYTLVVVVYPYPGYSRAAWSGPIEESYWEMGTDVHIAARMQIIITSVSGE